jgi:hypothetical protein
MSAKRSASASAAVASAASTPTAAPNAAPTDMLVSRDTRMDAHRQLATLRKECVASSIAFIHSRGVV